MGLLIGPSYTSPTFEAKLDKALRKKFDEGLTPGEPYFRAADQIFDTSAIDDDEALRQKIEDCISESAVESSSAAPCKKVASFPWSAVLSTGLDTTFDEEFRQSNNKVPAHRPVMTLTEAGAVVPGRCIPVFHLLGTATSGDLVVDGADYRFRQERWGEMCRDFIDRIGSDPVLCVGLKGYGEVFLDLIAKFRTVRGFGRARFIVLKEEEEIISKAVRRHLPSGSSIMVFDAHISDLLRAAQDARKAGYAPFLPFNQPTGEFASLAPFAELATVVNEQIKPGLGEGERHHLQDILFSPNSARWDPFTYELDLRRTAESEILDEVRSEPTYYQSEVCISGAITGAAASGKSTLFKRVALELAKLGHPVIWIKPSKFSDAPTELRRLFKALKEVESKEKRTIVCLDDPLSLFGIEPRDVYLAASGARVRSLLLVAVRTSDWEAEQDKGRLTGCPASSFHFSLPDDLDDDEWDRMPAFMVALNAASDEAEARRMLDSHGEGARRRDSLATMYWALQGVRDSIKDSVRQEYFRLGRGAAKKIVGALVSTGPDALQKAYGFVAVGERIGVPVPTEVLVSAIGCSYEEWHLAVPGSGLAWGVLYEQIDEHGDVLGYRCRNDIVADVVASILNGSALGHSGEFRELKTLLAACDGSGPAYRAFVRQALVNNNRLRIRNFEREEILTLIDVALDAFSEDSVLIHHKAIHLTKAGRPREAMALLDKALALPPETYGSRQEQSEHLHTTYASAIIELHERGEIDDAQALQDALYHLERARSDTYHNAKAVHVQARLAIRIGDTAENASDRYALLTTALADLERYLLYYSAPLDHQLEPADATLLEEIRTEVLEKAIPNEVDLEKHAESLWAEKQDQMGFALYARRLLAEATRRIKGKLYKELDEYCRSKLALVREAGNPPLKALLEATLSGYFRWRVREQGRDGYSGYSSEIDWKHIHDLAEGVVENVLTGYPTFQYMLAVAKAHLGDWPGADEVFSRVKAGRMKGNVMWAKRDVLRTGDGAFREIQGVVRRSPRGVYLRVDELGYDIPASDRDHWPNEGGHVSAFVVFAFGGYRAVRDVKG